MTKRICLIVSMYLIGCTSLSENQPKLSEDPRLSQSHLEMSFEDLSQVGHYILKAFDKEENICAIPQGKIFSSPQMYRSLVDEKYSEVQDIYLKKPLKEKVQFWNPACALSCSCDVYIGFSEYLQSFNFLLSATELKAVEKLKLLQEHEKARTSACMRQARWVCQSRVLKEIIKRAE